MEVSQNLWKIAGSGRSISPVLLERARELRKQQTPTEEILWGGGQIYAFTFFGLRFWLKNPVVITQASAAASGE
jgi:very-short-patch-repair endonuclease